MIPKSGNRFSDKIMRPANYANSAMRSRTRSIKRGVAGGSGGDQRAVHHVRAIIDKPPPRKVGHHAAGFVHQKVGRRKIPIVAAAGGKGGIELAMRDADKPQRQREDFGLGGDLRMQAAQAIEIALGAGELGAGQSRARACQNARAVERGALPARGQEHLVRHRRINSGELRDAVLDQRHRDGPVGAAGNIGAGAVDRIDDPGERHAAVGQGLGFLRQPTGVGRERAQARAQEIVDGDIALAHRRIVVALGPALERRARHGAGDFAGLAHDGFERRKQLIARQR